MKVAALCISHRSVYKQLPDVECYDIERDVRTFPGDMPVVAHPPCRAWSAFFAHQVKPLEGEKELGLLCVEFVKQCGGVLEHPARSRLWTHCDLPNPGEPCRDGVWSLEVHQSWFGYSIAKRTWLMFSGIEPRDVHIPFRLHGRCGDSRRFKAMSRTQRAATTAEMAAWLVAIARVAKVVR